MKKKVLALTAVMALGIFSAAAANDNVTFSKPVRLLKPNVQSSFEKDFEWNDVDYSTFEAVLPSIKYDLFIFVSTHNKRWACAGKWVSTAECQEEKGQLFVFFLLLVKYSKEE